MSTGNSKPGIEAVLVDSDVTARNTLKAYLTAQGVRVTAVADDLASGLHAVRSLRRGIVVLELPSNPTETLEAVRRIRVDAPHVGIVLTSSEMSPDLILRSIRAGAQEFLPRPVDIRELGEAVNRLGALLTATTGSGAFGGRIVSLFSCKGGTGVTSLAVNLAVALAKSGAKTVLVDLDLQMGDAALMLDLRPAHTLADVLRGGALDEAKLRSLLVPHSSGLRVLVGPDGLDAADEITPAHISGVLDLLQQMFEYVIVDAGRNFDSRPLEALNMSDIVLLVAVPSVPAARNLKKGIEMLAEMGLPRNRMRLLLNRHRKGSIVRLQDLEDAVGADIFRHVPSDDRTMDAAINAGIPAVLNAPRSDLARGITGLAAEIATLHRAAPVQRNEAAAN